MAGANSSAQRSAFKESGFSSALSALKEEVKSLYLADEVPWVIGYSGGKDSTAVLQLTWLALSELGSDRRKKPVYVITTDTLVENPVVAAWVSNSLNTMRKAAAEQHLPVLPNLLKPELHDTFWVNLIGKGYPAPRHKFRWCTERLKINPSNRFIQSTISKYGEAVLLLGMRKAESSARARSIEKHKNLSGHEKLAVHSELINCMVYAPLEDWSNDDVWMFLMQVDNPWGYSNKDLLSMYRGASEDNECPVVVDTSTPSCGNSRFGCWVCTLVDQDKSMTAMIQNDQEKEWMLPLLNLRNEFDFRADEARARDRERRDFRRLSGHLSYYKNKDGELSLVPGPYTQEAREHWLRKLLKAQQHVRENPNAPDHVRNIELISLEELQEIRRIWMVEKHEIEDRLPKIYEEETGFPLPLPPVEESLVFDEDSLQLLKDICKDDLQYELARNLIDIERRYRTKGVRRGLFQQLERTIRQCFYKNSEDAIDLAKRKASLKESRFVSLDGEEINLDQLEPPKGTSVRESSQTLLEKPDEL